MRSLFAARLGCSPVAVGGSSGRAGGRRTELASTTPVAPALLACATTAVSAAKVGAPGPNGALIVVPLTVPARPATPASSTAIANAPVKRAP